MKRLLQLRNKKYQKGGFTLVELIVVLVILATWPPCWYRL